MRVSGLTTGLDWEELVHKLMQVEKRPLVLLQNRVKNLEREQEAWRSVNSSLLNLRTKAEALSKPALWKGMTTESSNPGVVTASAGANAEAGSYLVTVTQMAQAHSVASAQHASPAEALGFSGEFTVKGSGETETIEVLATDSLRDIRDKLASSSAGVQSSILDNRLIITRSQTGPESLVFTDPSGILESIGILDEGVLAMELSEPREAVFDVNGLTVTRDTNQVTDLIDGVTLALQGLGVSEVVVESDLESMMTAVDAFVDRYNSSMDKMRSYSNRDQKGELVGDSTIRRLISDMRQTVSSGVGSLSGSDYTALFQVGLASTDRSGRLSFSREKLLEAWRDDHQSVQALFTAADGPFSRMETQLDHVTRRRGLIDNRTDSLGRRQRMMIAQAERMEERLELRQRTLFRQFEALEMAMSRMQTQSAWLDQQLTNLSNR